jgi:hypothetical protein
VWDLSEAGDKANKLSETDGELMQYKRRIDNIIQRSSALDEDDKVSARLVVTCASSTGLDAADL